jgi:hypothetical protein
VYILVLLREQHHLLPMIFGMAFLLEQTQVIYFKIADYYEYFTYGG